jgi:stage II sporulation protein E
MSEPNVVKNTEVLRTPVLRDFSVSALLLLASRAAVFGTYPFGAAMFAACFDKSIAYLGVTVLCIGLMTTGVGVGLVKYLIAALLFWIFTRINPPFKRHRRIMESVVCGASVFVGGLAVLTYSFVGAYDILLLFMESIISAIMYIIFQKAKGVAEDGKKRRHIAQDELISVAVCIGVFITGMSGIVFPLNVSLANIVSVYAVMCLAMHSSLAAAGSGGLCIGFMSSMSSVDALLTMGIYGLSALFGNLLKGFGKFGVAIGFLGGAAVTLLYTQSAAALPVSVLDIAIGAAAFMITPKKAHNKIGAFFSRSLALETVGVDVRMREYLAMQLEHSANAFKSLEDCFSSASDKRLKLYNKEIGSLFDEVSDRVCEGCSMAQKCWQTNFAKTYRNIMLLLDTIETNGILTIGSVPRAFREGCIRTELFVVEFNHVYELYKKNLVRTGEATIGRDLVAKQYHEIANLMSGMSREIEEGFVFREDLENEIVNELDKLQIAVFEVSVVESEHGKIEIFLNISQPRDTEIIAAVLSEIVETPIGFDSELQNGLKFVSKPRYAADIGVRRLSRDDSDISGDGITAFTTDDYKLYVILSDGMGSGKEAMLESHVTLKLLKEFLQSGFGIKTAINMINSALCLKLDYECFSTVDLMCVDLISGMTEFYKIGGAESFICKNGGVETVYSVSLPVGMLPDVKIQGQTKKLGDGDIVLMMSDGITEAGYGAVRTDWLKKQIRMPYETMDDMAQDILDTAIKKCHDAVTDDMTVAAIRLEEV